jgi:hypothetical protein
MKGILIFAAVALASVMLLFVAAYLLVKDSNIQESSAEMRMLLARANASGPTPVGQGSWESRDFCGEFRANASVVKSLSAYVGAKEIAIDDGTDVLGGRERQTTLRMLRNQVSCPPAQDVASNPGRFSLFAVWGRPPALRFGSSQWEYLIIAHEAGSGRVVYVSSYAYG